MKKEISYLAMEKIINKYYITAKDISILANTNLKYARRIANEIAEEMIIEGLPPLSTRPLLIPTDRVVKKLKINRKLIRQEANSIRKSGWTA